jgi:hypothetical protein
MISSKLLKRLEELEDRLAPAVETVTLQIIGVSPDGSKTEGPRFEVQMPAVNAPARQRKVRWRS